MYEDECQVESVSRVFKSQLGRCVCVCVCVRCQIFSNSWITCRLVFLLEIMCRLVKRERARESVVRLKREFGVLGFLIFTWFCCIERTWF